MLATSTPLSPADLERIGRLHAESIDDSHPALLGVRYAGVLYQFLAGSEHEVLFTEAVDGQVESCCVVSLDPDSLFTRIARGTWPALVRDALLALRLRAFRSYLLGTLRDALKPGKKPGRAPEITFIFSNRDVRGRGFGRVLIERVDRYLQESGFGVYYVKTLDEPANRAIGFYEEQGFAPIDRCEEAGRTFVEFEKQLAPAEPA